MTTRTLDRGPSPFDDMAAVRIANAAAGQVWFSKSTMEWFDCKVESRLIRGRYFITSNDPFRRGRRFQAHYAQNDGSIETFENPEAEEGLVGWATQAEVMTFILGHDGQRS